eukprot:NP_508874.2 Uncharacterized protein CELE_C31H2.3 [Caenorhabditis elegans]
MSRRSLTPQGRPPKFPAKRNRSVGVRDFIVGMQKCIIIVHDCAERVTATCLSASDCLSDIQMEGSSPIAPHRGFNRKARVTLLDKTEIDRVMPKSSSEFDIRKKLNSMASRKKDSSDSSPKSQCSVSSIPEHPTFDSIGERPNVKKHMKLGDLGKTRSCVELKTNDKRLLRTFQEDNIIKMPSMDSDIGDDHVTGVNDLCLSFEGLGKSLIYSQSDDNNSNDVKSKKAKN